MPDLLRTSPEKQGISSSAILKFIEGIEAGGQEVHSFILVRHASVVAEGWWSPHGADIPHMMFSLSKSFTSTAVGMAVSEGYFTVDDSVISFFPDDLPENLGSKFSEMQLRHLLSMSTGHAIPTFPFMYGQKDGNWAKGFFEVPLEYTPGTQFLYNTGATYMLSEIVQRTTGLNLIDFLTPRLFEPLGIKNPVWSESPSGVNLGGVGLNLITENIARFGQLYLQKGLWEGKRLLDESWIEDATSAHVSNGDDPDSDWTQGYGYQFWRSQHGLYRGDGAFGQFCIVMEDYDAVLAMTSAAQDMQEIMNLAWDILLPAMEHETLDEDTENHAVLVNKLSKLSLKPLQGELTSPIVAWVSGKTYVAEANDARIEQVSIEFAESSCRLKLKTAQGEQEIISGYGAWHHGQTSRLSLFTEIWLSDSLPYVASSAWLAEDCFLVQIRLYETPYIYIISCQFEGENLTMSTQINLSLVSSESPTIKTKMLP